MEAIRSKLIRVQDVISVEPFRIVCRWSNGDIRVNDLTQNILQWRESRNSYLAQLANPDIFKTAFAPSGTIAFRGVLVDTGDLGLQPLDLDPDVLFENSKLLNQPLTQADELEKNFNYNLQELLSNKVKLEKKVAQLISSESPVRFSYKKFVADLGEYYFFTKCRHLFEENSLTQAKTSNASVDFIGNPSILFRKQFNLNSTIKIEVKTRYHQKGNPHIFGLDTAKFDLLAFVSINEDYSFDYVGLLKASDIKPDTQKRIRFFDYKNFILWSNKPFTPYN